MHSEPGVLMKADALTCFGYLQKGSSPAFYLLHQTQHFPKLMPLCKYFLWLNLYFKKEMLSLGG